MYKTWTCTSESPKGKKGPYPHTSSLQSLCPESSLLCVSVSLLRVVSCLQSGPLSYLVRAVRTHNRSIYNSGISRKQEDTIKQAAWRTTPDTGL